MTSPAARPVTPASDDAAASVTPPLPLPLSQRLREATAELHRQAERSGIMFDLLRGRLERGAYAVLLRDLLEVYTALEERLDASAGAPALRGIHDPALHRVASLRDDLASLHGARWEADLAPGEAALRYAARLRSAPPVHLAVHAWVRYLGDLSGGQALGGVIARALALPQGAAGEGVAFYRFPGIADVASYKQRFRAALDAIPLDAAEADAAVLEGQEAFRLNVRVFEDVARRTGPSAAPPPPPAG